MGRVDGRSADDRDLEKPLKCNDGQGSLSGFYQSQESLSVQVLRVRDRPIRGSCQDQLT
jgi:hypothetical protein